MKKFNINTVLSILLSCLLLPGTLSAAIYDEKEVLPDEKIAAIIDIIDTQLNNGLWKEAAENIVGLMKLDPAHPRNMMLFYNLGVCQHNLSKYEDALESFDIVLSKNPDFTSGLYRRALTYMALDSLESSNNDLTRILVLTPRDNDARFLRALNYFTLGEIEKARVDVDCLLEMQEKKPAPKEWLLLGARIYNSEKEYKKASEIYKELLSATPEKDIYVETIFNCLEDPELSETAQELIHQSIGKFPQEGRIFLAQAILCKRNFQNTEMQENIKIAKKYGVDSQIIDFFINKN